MIGVVIFIFIAFRLAIIRTLLRQPFGNLLHILQSNFFCHIFKDSWWGLGSRGRGLAVEGDFWGLISSSVCWTGTRPWYYRQ